ncbi:hypothetical protein MY10362_000303 [Beauveria mimosiformis]
MLLGPPDVVSYSKKDAARRMSDTEDRDFAIRSQSPLKCGSLTSTSTSSLCSESPSLPPSSVSAVSTGSLSSLFDTVDEAPNLPTWAGDLALPPTILSSDPVYSAAQTEPQPRLYSTIRPAAIQNTPEKATTILQPVPKSAVQRNAILALLDSHL